MTNGGVEQLSEGDYPDLHPALQELTLGARKSVVRLAGAKDIGKVVLESDPAVLPILLSNPYLTEPDVIKIAARRPQRPELFLALLEHGKWMVLRSVLKAIALNPYAPLRLAVRVLPLMLRQDLIEIKSSERIANPIRLFARNLLAARP